MLWWVWPEPNATPSSGATWRETRDKIHPRYGPVSCSAVTLRLGPKRRKPDLSQNRPSHFHPGGAAASPRHVLQICTDLHGLLSTRRELARAGFIATLRRSPPEASNTSVRRTEVLDLVNPKEAPRKCGARVKWSSLWQSNA